MIDDEIRELMPPEQRLSAERRQLLRERIMAETQPTGTGSPGSEDDRADVVGIGGGSRRGVRRTRRRVAAGIAAAIVVAGGAAAAATAGWFTSPDPQQAATVTSRIDDPVGELYDDAWRPPLQAEWVACVYADSNRLLDPRESGNTLASEFPLTDMLTTDLLISECAGDSDWARIHGGYDVDLATACVRRGEYPLAVVALDGLDCADTGVGVVPMTDDDLAELNTMRAFEVAALAVPPKCPTVDEAADWVRARMDEHDIDLPIRVTDNGTNGCYWPTTYWQQGFVAVEQMTSWSESGD